MTKMTFEYLRPEIEAALVRCLGAKAAEQYQLVEGFMHYGLSDIVGGKPNYRASLVALIHSKTAEMRLFPIAKLLPYMADRDA